MPQRAPDQRVGDLRQRGGGSETPQGGSDSHPEHGEDGGLGPCWVWLSEELQGHLAVRLDHGLHRGLLGGVLDRVNVYAVSSVVGLRVRGKDEIDRQVKT